MNRRGFLQSILAASIAPAFVPSSSLMLLVPRRIESGSDIALSRTIYVISLKDTLLECNNLVFRTDSSTREKGG